MTVKLARFDKHWSPKIVGELNGQHVKLVKFLGEFVWHHHDDGDEMFLVVDGRFRMEFSGTERFGSKRVSSSW
jgi:mannose-6-phosphate isomerase-like protein (cupin superfamily)